MLDKIVTWLANLAVSEKYTKREVEWLLSDVISILRVVILFSAVFSFALGYYFLFAFISVLFIIYLIVSVVVRKKLLYILYYIDEGYDVNGDKVAETATEALDKLTKIIENLEKI